MQADGLCLKFAADRRGVTALEYGILAGVLGLVLISIFAGLGSKLSSLFAMLSGSL
jgi:Flp pilus assembly pilin Flp